MATTESKKLYVNKLTESIQLSSLLFAPVFSAIPVINEDAVFSN